MTARPMEFLVVSAGFGAGKFAPVTFVKVLEPVVVAKTSPSRIPTMRTLSSCVEIPTVVTTTPEPAGLDGTNGPWLTSVMESPRLVER